MKKLDLIQRIKSKPEDFLSKYIKIYLDSDDIKKLDDEVEISAVDFADHIEPIYTEGMEGLLGISDSFEGSKDPFWSGFISGAAKLVLRGISVQIIERLQQYDYVNFDELYLKIKSVELRAGFKAGVFGPKQITEFWECMILTGHPEAVDAAIKYDYLSEQTPMKSFRDPLFLALFSGSVSQLECVIKTFPSLLARIRPNNWTLLHEAVDGFQLEMVKCLLKHGMPVDIKKWARGITIGCFAG